MSGGRWGVWCEPVAGNHAGRPEWLHKNGRPVFFATREEAETSAQKATQNNRWTFTSRYLPPDCEPT